MDSSDCLITHMHDHYTIHWISTHTSLPQFRVAGTVITEGELVKNLVRGQEYILQKYESAISTNHLESSNPVTLKHEQLTGNVT